MLKKTPGIGIVGTLLVSASILFFATPAKSADGWYLNINGGANFNRDADVEVPSLSSNDFETSQDTGAVMWGALGRRFKSGFRVEGEVSYRKNNFDDISVSVPATLIGVALSGTTVLSGDITTFGFMGNLAYDFDTGSKLHPYVLVGLGGAYVSANDITASSILLVDDDDFVFAYQTGTGIYYAATDRFSIGLSYRFFSTADPDFTGTDNITSLSTKNINHSVLAGFTFNF